MAMTITTEEGLLTPDPGGAKTTLFFAGCMGSPVAIYMELEQVPAALKILERLEAASLKALKDSDDVKFARFVFANAKDARRVLDALKAKTVDVVCLDVMDKSGQRRRPIAEPQEIKTLGKYAGLPRK